MSDPPPAPRVVWSGVHTDPPLGGWSLLPASDLGVMRPANDGGDHELTYPVDGVGLHSKEPAPPKRKRLIRCAGCGELHVAVRAGTLRCNARHVRRGFCATCQGAKLDDGTLDES